MCTNKTPENGLDLLNNLSSVYVDDSSTEYHISSKRWSVEVMAPDEHYYPLRGEWSSSDLVDFVKMYPLDDPNCYIVFTYRNEECILTFVPNEFEVVLVDGVYDVHFI